MEVARRHGLRDSPGQFPCLRHDPIHGRIKTISMTARAGEGSRDHN